MSETLIWIGIAVLLFAVWMWWKVEHAEEMPEDYDEQFPDDDYSDDWFDENKPVF